MITPFYMLALAFACCVAGVALGEAICPITWLCHKCGKPVGTAPQILYPWLYGRWHDINCPHCKRDLLRPAAGVGEVGELLIASEGANRPC